MDDLHEFALGEQVQTLSGHTGKVAGPASGRPRLLVECEGRLVLACLPSTLTRLTPTPAPTTYALTPDGVAVTLDLGGRIVTGWLEPWEALALGREARDQWGGKE